MQQWYRQSHTPWRISHNWTCDACARVCLALSLGKDDNALVIQPWCCVLFFPQALELGYMLRKNKLVMLNQFEKPLKFGKDFLEIQEVVFQMYQ